jgi:DNA repair exonuclease SbcCD nuclease subunit
MTTKILAIGDPHIKTTNLDEVNLFTEKLFEYLKDNLPDIIVVLGDSLDTHDRIDTTPLNVVYEFIKKLRDIAPTYVLVGNHDLINNRQFLSQNHWLNGMKQWKHVIIVDKVKHLIHNGKKFVFCPYVEPGRLQEALNTCETDWKDSDCLFIHQEMENCKMGSIISIEGDKWPLNYPEIISGHIHSNQTPQKNIYYPGSALQHAFGESEKNIIAIATFSSESNRYVLDEIDLKLPRKKIVYLIADDIDTYELPETDDKLKVTISGVYDQFKSFKKTKKYKNLIQKGVKVVFKPKRIEIKEQKEKVYESDDSCFNDILHTLVTNYKDPYLSQAYELVVNNKQVKSDMIFV